MQSVLFFENELQRIKVVDDYNDDEEHDVLFRMPPELAARIKRTAIAHECSSRELLVMALEAFDDVTEKLPAILETVRATNRKLGVPEPVGTPVRLVYRTSRGAELPYGLNMWAEYRGNRFTASVVPGGIQTADGKMYPDPSAAAVACKVATGVAANSAQTNGWNFWMFQVTDNRIAAIDMFRRDPDRAWNEWKTVREANDANAARPVKQLLPPLPRPSN